MKDLNLEEVPIANRRIVQKQYDRNKKYILIAEEKLKNNEYDSLYSLVACEFPEINYHSLYSAFVKWADYKITREKNGKSKATLISARKKRKISNDNFKQIQDLYLFKGKSLKEIGQIYNTSTVTVMKFLEEHGVKRRSKQEIMKTRLQNPAYREFLRDMGIKAYIKQHENFQSKPEKQFETWLISNNIKYISQYRQVGNGHPYDFLLTDYNLLVEIDGYYWHSFESQKEKDKKHIEDARAKGYNITRICTKELEEDNGDYSKWICLN